MPTIPPASKGSTRLRWALPDAMTAEGTVLEQETSARTAQASEAALSTRQLPGLTPPPVPQRRRRRALVAAIVAVVVLAGAGGGLAASLRSSGSARSARAFERLLVLSGRAHGLVEQAVAGVCASSSPGVAARAKDMAELQEAVSLRDIVLSGLSTDQGQAHNLPNGPLLFTQLRSVTLSSLDADDDYEAWVQDRQALGCYSAPFNDVFYRQAQQAATVADQDVQELAATWVKVAPSLRLPVGMAANA